MITSFDPLHSVISPSLLLPAFPIPSLPILAYLIQLFPILPHLILDLQMSSISILLLPLPHIPTFRY
ncbi:unnamed protein product [Gordionus sp. m RMFG-2023]